MDDESYLYLKRKILKLTDINLDEYKSQQMRRRLNTYLAHTGARSVVDYCHTIENNRDTLMALLDFLTINVSEFFRDINVFDKLQKSILPAILKNSQSKVNIWSAGCSKGQEPYTIAMIMESIAPSQTCRILATDIDEGALKIAKAGGPYTGDDVKNIPQSTYKRYFTAVDGKHMINDKLVKKIEFRQQNLLHDVFEKDFDLIICRNVTIYFTDEAKRELNKRFYNSLKNKGVLFIGGTEVMLDAQKIGFSGMGISFYQKNEIPRDIPDILKSRIPISA
jgi:chemotaxis protein methyltransferase CheR